MASWPQGGRMMPCYKVSDVSARDRCGLAAWFPGSPVSCATCIWSTFGDAGDILLSEMIAPLAAIDLDSWPRLILNSWLSKMNLNESEQFESEGIHPWCTSLQPSWRFQLVSHSFSISSFVALVLQTGDAPLLGWAKILQAFWKFGLGLVVFWGKHGECGECWEYGETGLFDGLWWLQVTGGRTSHGLITRIRRHVSLFLKIRRLIGSGCANHRGCTRQALKPKGRCMELYLWDKFC